MVDLVSNLDHLAEDPKEILKNIASKLFLMDHKKLAHSLKEYGSIKAKKIMLQMLNKN